MKLGIIGSGMIVHDFLTTADQVANMTVTAISSTKRSENIARELAKKYNIKRTYTDNEELMAELRGAVRFLSCHYATCEDIESQDEARELISSVLADKKFHDHAVLAFDDVDREDVINYNKAVANDNKQMINAIQNSIIHTKTIRKQFGL